MPLIDEVLTGELFSRSLDEVRVRNPFAGDRLPDEIDRLLSRPDA